VTLRTIGRRAIAVTTTAMVCVTGCSFQGANSLPLPGTVGGGASYTVELANVGTLEPNSPVMINDVVIGNVRHIRVAGRHADVEISVRPGVDIPANAAATVGQTSLLGSMHLELTTPVGQSPTGALDAGATIPLNRSSTYPSTEQTLAALSAVVNAGGLGQMGDIIHSLNSVFAGRQSDIRDLLGRLDTFVGTLNDQRDNIIATVTELNRFAAAMAGQRDVISRALDEVPAALDVLLRERPRLIEALNSMRVFSDTATAVTGAVKADLLENLRHLAPTLRALVAVGPEISQALGFATTFPLNQNIIDRGIRGDYMNLFVTVDLTLGRFKRGLLAGTSFGDENAPLVPAPGDPGYASFYSKNPLGEAVAPPVGVLGPERLPTAPPAPPGPPPPGGGG
jgi:virulence factor Mce-like protein